MIRPNLSVYFMIGTWKVVIPLLNYFCTNDLHLTSCPKSTSFCPGSCTYIVNTIVPRCGIMLINGRHTIRHQREFIGYEIREKYYLLG
jgi:hypothetical protein